jgi:hypothetical protein
MRKKKPKQPTPKNPSTEEQSGSAGRKSDTSGEGQSKDTGQDRYGQSGFSGKKPKP